MTDSSLGDIIRDRRTARGWDQPELARQMGVTQQTLSRWENSVATPRPAKLLLLAVVLEVDPKTLRSAALAGSRSTPATSAVLAHVPTPLPNLPLHLLSEDQFEEFAVALAQEQNPSATVYRNGSRGHKQDGIDVFIDRPGGQPRGGIQCKKVAQFGKALVRGAVAEFDASTRVVEPVIFLSRSVSPDARREVAANPGWTIFGSDDLSREVRRLSSDAQARLVTRFFPGLRQAFLGVTGPSPWLTPEQFRRPLDSTDGMFSQGWDLVGRDGELTSLVEFSRGDAQPLYVLEAPAGSGKTRLLLGLADALADDADMSVRFLDPGTDVSAPDFELLPDTVGLVIVIEDAHRRVDLSGIIRGVKNERPHARVVLATRSYNRSELQEQLRPVGIRLRENENLFTLKGFLFAQARDLALQVVVPKFQHNAVLDALAQLGVDSPFFVVIGGQLLNQGRITTNTLESSPELRTEVLDAFRTAMVGSGSDADTELRTDILAAVAAMQPFRSDQENFQNSIERLIGKKYRHLTAVLSHLEDAGLLIRKGSTYRVSPDLLGDIILARSLVHEDTGVVTSYARELVDALDDDVLEHALVNVSRADAQIQAAGLGGPTIMDALWNPFRESIALADIGRRVELAGLLKKVAYYQPSRSREVVEWLIQNPFIGPEQPSPVELLFGAVPGGNETVRRSLVPVLERVAYHADQLTAAMQDLRGLVDRSGGQEDPATKALRGLADFSAPLEYVALAVDTAIGWLKEPELSEVDRALVFEIIAPALATEFTADRSEGMTIYFGARLVHEPAVKDLRRRVINLALTELQSGEPSRSVASSLLEDALRYPIGFFGQAISDAQRESWIPDFMETLSSLQVILSDAPTTATVEAVRTALSWHVTYGTDAFATEARKLWAELPDDLNSNISLALRDGSPIVEHADFVEMVRARQQWQGTVADKLIGSASHDEILDLVASTLTAHAELGLTGDPGNFMAALFARVPELPSLLINRVLLDPSSPLVGMVGMAMQAEFVRAPSLIDDILARTLATGSILLRRVIAQALAWSLRDKSAATPEALEHVAAFARDPDDIVVQCALLAVRSLAEFDVPSALRIVQLVDFARSQSIASDVATQFGQHGHLAWAAVAPDKKKAIQAGLIALPDIDDYQIGQLISVIALDDHDAAVDLMLRRIEAEEDAGSKTSYRAVPFHAHSNLIAKDSGTRGRTMARIWDWMCGDPKSWHRQHSGTRLFWAVVTPSDQDVLDFIEAKSSGSAADFTILGNLLNGLPRTFVLAHSDFVARTIEAATVVGEDALKKVTGGFFGSIISGGRSRAIGVPDPEDVASRDRFATLASLAGNGPASDFFASMSEYFDREIQRNADEDDSLVDRHEW